MGTDEMEMEVGRVSILWCLCKWVECCGGVKCYLYLMLLGGEPFSWESLLELFFNSSVGRGEA